MSASRQRTSSVPDFDIGPAEPRLHDLEEGEFEDGTRPPSRFVPSFLDRKFLPEDYRLSALGRLNDGMEESVDISIPLVGKFDSDSEDDDRLNSIRTFANGNAKLRKKKVKRSPSPDSVSETSFSVHSEAGTAAGSDNVFRKGVRFEGVSNSLSPQDIPRTASAKLSRISSMPLDNSGQLNGNSGRGKQAHRSVSYTPFDGDEDFNQHMLVKTTLDYEDIGPKVQVTQSPSSSFDREDRRDNGEPRSLHLHDCQRDHGCDPVQHPTILEESSDDSHLIAENSVPEPPSLPDGHSSQSAAQRVGNLFERVSRSSKLYKKYATAGSETSLLDSLSISEPSRAAGRPTQSQDGESKLLPGADTYASRKAHLNAQDAKAAAKTRMALYRLWVTESHTSKWKLIQSMVQTKAFGKRSTGADSEGDEPPDIVDSLTYDSGEVTHAANIFSMIDDNNLTALETLPLNVILRSFRGQSSLHYALCIKNVEAATILARRGRDPLILFASAGTHPAPAPLHTSATVTVSLETSMHRAATLGSVSLVKTFWESVSVERRVDLVRTRAETLVDEFSALPHLKLRRIRATPADLAALYGHYDVVKFFMKCESECESLDVVHGLTVCLAALRRHMNILQLLLPPANGKPDSSHSIQLAPPPLQQQQQQQQVPGSKSKKDSMVDSTDGLTFVMADFIEDLTEDANHPNIRKIGDPKISHVVMRDPVLIARARLLFRDENGLCPLHYALMSNCHEVVTILLNACNTYTVDFFFKELRVFNPLVFGPKVTGLTVEAYETLLDDEKVAVYVNTPSGFGDYSPLHSAAHLRDEVRGPRFIRALLNRGASPRLKNKRGRTPFMTAALFGNLTSALTLGRAEGFVLSHHDSEGKTVIDYAMERKAATTTANTESATASNRGRSESDSDDVDGSEESVPSSTTGNELLVAILEMLAFKFEANHMVKGRDDRQRLFAQFSVEECGGESPLHVAAALGDEGKLKIVRHYISKLGVINDNGENFLHVAAQYGNHALLEAEALGKPWLVNQQNKQGNTVLHVACLHCQEMAARVVLTQSLLDVQNTDGRTPLHLMADLADQSLEFVEAMIARLSEASSALLAIKDHIHGSTALHIFAGKENLHDREGIFSALLFSTSARYLVNETDNSGNTPLHVALEAGQTHNFIAILQLCKRDVDLNKTNNAGFAVLHLAVQTAAPGVVPLLVRYGANLTQSTDAGLTALHIIMNCIKKNEKRTRIYLKVMHEVLDSGAEWLCRRRGRGGDMLMGQKEAALHRKKAILHLTSAGTAEKPAPLFYAAELALKSVVEEILNLDGVFAIDGRTGRIGKEALSPDCVYYDVTNFVPNTVAYEQISSLEIWKMASEGLMTVTPDNVYDDPALKRFAEDLEREARLGGGMRKRREGHTDGGIGALASFTGRQKYRTPATVYRPRRSQKRTLVETIITGQGDDRLKLLEIRPIEAIVRDYWSPYRSAYICFLLFHIAYMAAFSALSVCMISPSGCLGSAVGNVTNETVTDMAYPELTSAPEPPLHRVVGWFSLFALWPGFIVLYDLIYLWKSIKMHETNGGSSLGFFQSVFWHPMAALERISFWFTGIIFSYFTLAYFVAHYFNHSIEPYLLSLVLIIGWAYSLHFTQGFQSIHHFSLIMQRLLLRDILKFTFIFCFILIGFGFAFHLLFQLNPSIAGPTQTVGASMFVAFSWALGLEPFFKWDEARHSFEATFLKIVYSMFVVILNLALLNMLIAIMNDSFSAIQARHRIVWQINTLRRAFTLERHIPLLRDILSKWRNSRDIIVDNYSSVGRFYLRVHKEQPEFLMTEDDNIQVKLLHQVSSLNAVQDGLVTAIASMKQQMEAISDDQRYLREEQERARKVSPGSSWLPSAAPDSGTVNLKRQLHRELKKKRILNPHLFQQNEQQRRRSLRPETSRPDPSLLRQEETHV